MATNKTKTANKATTATAATNATATAASLQAITSLLQTTAANATVSTLHNVLLAAQKQVATMPATTALASVLAIGGYNCGGWRKTALQHVAAAFGLVPFIGNHTTKPAVYNQPKTIGQQAYFYGNANAANVAAIAYNAIFIVANKAGNAALRAARTTAKANKTKAANGNLQVNVYNMVMQQVLASLASIKPMPPAGTLVRQFAQTYPQTTVAGGGMVLNGAYHTASYSPTTNGLPMVKIN